jgi:hypothetical protein
MRLGIFKREGEREREKRERKNAKNRERGEKEKKEKIFSMECGVHSSMVLWNECSLLKGGFFKGHEGQKGH